MAGNHPISDMFSTSFELQDSPDIDPANESKLEISEYIAFEEWFDEEDPTSMVSGTAHYPLFPANQVDDPEGSSSQPEGPSRRDSGSGQEKKKAKEKVAFKTKSEVEILDDGFKWKKYGKKMVKNSLNPRNYYRCSAEGCPVKKRVERDSEDPRYVITTYEGTHIHQSPSGF